MCVCVCVGYGVDWLGELLVKFQVLAHLDISYNKIGAEGAWKLAEVLPQCTALIYLDLSGNYLAHFCGHDLWEFVGVLAECPALAHLNLSDNHIRWEWKDVCVPAVHDGHIHHHIHEYYDEYYDDNDDPVTAPGAQCLASLTHLDLSGNNISAEVVLRLRAALGGDPFKLVL